MNTFVVISDATEYTVNAKNGNVIFTTNPDPIMIDHFDVDEYRQYYNQQISGSVDIICIGYWTKDNQYEPPVSEYREGK